MPTRAGVESSGRRGDLGRSGFLRLVGVAVGLCAATLGDPSSPSTAAAMIAAIALFALAERSESSRHGVIPAVTPIAWPLGVRLLLGAAVALCLGSALAVYREASLAVQHLPWAAALVLLAVAAAAAKPPTAALPLRRVDMAALAALTIACIPLFFWSLGSIPAEVHGDEAETALDALRLLEEPHRGVFSTSWFGLPILHAAPTALSFVAFGPDLLAVRLTSAVLAWLSVLLLFAVVRRLCGTPLAFTAALVLACQRYFVHLARAGYHYVDTPFLSLLALWLMLRLWQDRRASSAIWCGVALGLGVQTYYASRLVPLLLAATTLAFAALAPRGAGVRRRRYVAELALVAVIAIAVAAPLFAHFAHNLDEFWGRTQETSIFNPEARRHLAYGYGTDALPDVLAIQLRKALSVFHFTGDTSVQYGYLAPMLDLASGVLFLAGVGALVARPGSPLTIVALLWIALPLLLGGAMTIDTPFYPRISGIVPFAALVVAVGAFRVAAALAETFAAPSRRALAGGLLLAAIIAVVGGLNTGSYFGHYTRNYRHSPMRDIAEWIRDQGRGSKTYLFDERRATSIYHGAITFLAGSFARADVDDLDEFLADPYIDRRRSRFIVMRGSENVLPRLEEKFGPLEIATVSNRHGHARFYTAKPLGQDDHGLEPRPPEVDRSRAVPWLGLLAVLAGLATVPALRAQSDRPPPSDETTVSEDDGEHRLDSPLPPPVAEASEGKQGEGIPAGRPAGQAAFSRPAIVACLILIVAVAGWLRLAELERLPAGFYCDEAGNIYNAASILRTGRDETGELLPLYVWSFGTSYKNPVFIYAATIPAAILGPGPLAARITAAAFGIAAVVAIFFLGRAMFGAAGGLFAAAFLAVVPWHLHFSRVAFELISFPTLFTIGAIGLASFLNGRRSLVWAAALLGLSLYTYVPAKMFVPLFLAGYALVYRRELWRRRRETAVALAVLAAVAAPVVVFDVANQQRAGSYLRETTFITPEMSVVEIAAQVAKNYSHFFSPIFLFQNGDQVTRHAVRGHGELYPVLAPLLLIGLLAIAGGRSRSAAMVLIWLALYPLAATFIKREIPSASRAIIGVPAFCLLAAAGAEWIWRRLGALAVPRFRGGVARGLALAAFALILGAQTVRYWRLYAETYPLYSAKTYMGFQYGHQQVVDYFVEHYDEYDRLVLTTSLSNQPEIFLRLFAGMKYPPSQGAPPFEMPAKINRGNPTELGLYGDDRLLFAAVPRDLLYFADYEIVEKIEAPDGTAAFLLVEVREPKDFVHVWMIAGPYPAAETPPVPEYDPAAAPARAPGGRDWRRHQLRTAPVMLDVVYGEDIDRACAWAINFVHSAVEQTVQVYAGFDDSGEIWVDDRQIALRDEDNPFATWVDTSVGTIELRAGRNKVAVKTCDEDGGWRFYFRLAGDDGKRVPGIDWEYVFEEGL